MEKYSSGEIGFNLLAVCQDKLESLEKQLAEETREFRQRCLKYSYSLFLKLDKLFKTLIFSQLKEDIESEKSKRAQWEKDNVRRRHNWMPFVVEIVKQMAAQKLLAPAVKKVLDFIKID